MTITAGDEHALMRPLDPEGNYTPGSRGCHKGHMESLNVKNPQPGYHYYYIRTDSSSLDRAETRGWELVKLSDPERMGEEKRADRVAAGLDTSLRRNDIVLCRMPEPRYREMRERMNQLAEGTRDDGSSEYLERGRSLQERVGAREPLYFKSAGHGFRHITTGKT